jgi:hypothetical protein
MNSEDELTVNVARQFIDDLAELSESDNSSEDDENVPDLIDDSDEDVNGNNNCIINVCIKLLIYFELQNFLRKGFVD